MAEAVVNTSLGLLRGSKGTDFRGGQYHSFRGIPYAAPPVGNLRFKAPRPPQPWSGIKDATQEGNECYSKHFFYQNVVGSEDCLVLNVFTPELPPERGTFSGKPVMVYIHGGIFLTGSNRTELHSPDYLLIQDVVLVTINYRLGLLGFLSLEDPALGVPGNAGLKDMVMALQWVKNNITSFMGDPGNVTIFGESAGGAAVHYLMLSPLAKGLFHRAIAQSGCALNCWAAGYSCTKELVEHLNIESEDETNILEQLQQMPVETLLQAQEKLNHDFCACELRPVAPVVEKISVIEPNFLTKSPLEIILSGNYNKVPLLIGYTSREGMLFEVIQQDKHNPEAKMDFEKLIPHSYNLKNRTATVATKLKEFYYGHEAPSAKNRDKLYKLLTDSYFLEGIYRTVKLHTSTSSEPVYFYRMSVETQLNFFKNLANIDAPGVCHGDDLGYLFKTMVSPEVEAGSIEEIAILRFTKLWANFARYGNPNSVRPDTLIPVNWRAVTRTDVCVLDIGENLEVGPFPDQERMEFWETLQNFSQEKCKL